MKSWGEWATKRVEERKQLAEITAGFLAAAEEARSKEFDLELARAYVQVVSGRGY